MEKKQSKYRGQRSHLGWMLWLKIGQSWPCVRLMPGCGRCVAGPMDGICQLWREPHQRWREGLCPWISLPCVLGPSPRQDLPCLMLGWRAPCSPKPLLSTQRGEEEEDAQPAPHAMREEAKGCRKERGQGQKPAVQVPEPSPGARARWAGGSWRESPPPTALCEPLSRASPGPCQLVPRPVPAEFPPDH